METTHPTPTPSATRCEYCDAPAVVTIGSLTGREDVPVCESDIHLDRAIWGGER